MMYPGAFRHLLHDFAADESGTVLPEAVIVLPSMFWAYLATFVWFDAFRSETEYMKAAYAMADAVSREVSPITDNYMDSMSKMLDFMTSSPRDVQLRVSIICWSENQQKYSVAWSQTRGGASKQDNNTINNYEAHLPNFKQGDQVILLETFTRWEPAFNMGLKPREIYNAIVTRPRFAPQVKWDGNHSLGCSA